jgi:hypothetical protein
MVIRNGWFSYRWSATDFDMGGIPSTTVMKVIIGKLPKQRRHPGTCPDCRSTAMISLKVKPAVVFAPHVENLCRHDPSRLLTCVQPWKWFAVSGLFRALTALRPCDMQATGVDVLISASAKGLSSSPLRHGHAQRARC